MLIQSQWFQEKPLSGYRLISQCIQLHFPKIFLVWNNSQKDVQYFPHPGCIVYTFHLISSYVLIYLQLG